MSLILVGTFIIVLFLAVFVIFVILYNKFQRLQNGSEACLGQIKVALKKRLDMISQLVEIVKSYASFEKEVLVKITEMRSLAGRIDKVEDIKRIYEESRGILGKILLVVENYPNLKTSENVTKLMNSIKDVEDEIARQRYTYNNIVQDYNTRRGTIPSNFVAYLFRFHKLEYLQFEEEVEKRPDAEWNK